MFYLMHTHVMQPGKVLSPLWGAYNLLSIPSLDSEVDAIHPLAALELS